MSEIELQSEESKKQRKEAEDKAQRLRDRELNDIRKVLEFPEGRRLLWRVMSEARMFHISFVPGCPDQTDFNEGQRRVGNWLYNQIFRANPSAFQKMQREDLSEQNSKK
jgi:hypothetical protein